MNRNSPGRPHLTNVEICSLLPAAALPAKALINAHAQLDREENQTNSRGGQ